LEFSIFPLLRRSHMNEIARSAVSLEMYLPLNKRDERLTT